MFAFPLQIRNKQSLVSVTVFQITAVSIPLLFTFAESYQTAPKSRQIGRPWYMSMQPTARWHNPKHDFLAQPKHTTAQCCADRDWPSPMHRAVPGPHSRHAGWLGMARNLVAGPVTSIAC